MKHIKILILVTLLSSIFVVTASQNKTNNGLNNSLRISNISNLNVNNNLTLAPQSNFNNFTVIKGQLNIYFRVISPNFKDTVPNSTMKIYVPANYSNGNYLYWDIIIRNGSSQPIYQPGGYFYANSGNSQKESFNTNGSLDGSYSIKITLTLGSYSLNLSREIVIDNTTPLSLIYTAPTTTSSNSNTTPGFEVLAVIFILPVLLIVRKKKI